MALIDWGVVARAAAIALAILVPPIAIVRAFLGGDDDSPLWTVIPIAFLVAFPIGGGIASRRSPETPFLHAAVTGATAFGVALLAGIVRNLVTGSSMSTAALITAILFWQIATALAVLGALLSRRRRPSTTETERA